MALIETEEKVTRALLVSVDCGKFDAESSLDELCELVKSAGAEPVMTVLQKLDRPETATFVGTGKLEEIKEICSQYEIDLIVCDSEFDSRRGCQTKAENLNAIRFSVYCFLSYGNNPQKPLEINIFLCYNAFNEK